MLETKAAENGESTSGAAVADPESRPRAGAAPRAVSAMLLRRLAEAADGHRNREAWFVARYSPVGDTCMDVFDLSPHASEEEARAALAEKEFPDDYGVFGPYLTDDGTRPTFRIHDIEIRLRHSRTGQLQRPLRIEGHRFDALFYSLSALEKFAIPYYARLHGPAYAEQMRRDFLAKDFYLMGHLPLTEYDFVGPDGQPAPEQTAVITPLRGVATRSAPPAAPAESFGSLLAEAKARQPGKAPAPLVGVRYDSGAGKMAFHLIAPADGSGDCDGGA